MYDQQLSGVVCVSPGIKRILEWARSIAYLRPLGRYEGWSFGADWGRTEADFVARQTIWEVCRHLKTDLPIEFHWYDGLRLNLRLGNDLSRQLYIGGCADPNEFALLDQLLKPGMVVVDAGASVGLYTLFAARRIGPSGTVFSFEPSEREFARLQENIALNGLTNVRAAREALADRDGDADLLVAADEHEGHNTLGEFAHESVDLLRHEPVATCQLDTIRTREGLGRVDLIKMDIEGSETRLLRGSQCVLRECRPLIILEAADAALRKQGSNREDLLSTLRDAGYVLYSIGPDGRPMAERYGLEGENLIAAPAESPLLPEWCGVPRRSLADYVMISTGFSPAAAYWNQRARLAATRERIHALRSAVDLPQDMEPYQFSQLMAAVMEFRPDVIVELGRGQGNSTCAFAEASHQLGSQVRVVSVCNSGEWASQTVPRLRPIVEAGWFQPLRAIRADILKTDYAPFFAGARRAMLFWDAHGFEVAECVLGAIMPLMAELDHVVIMHDISDTRYQGLPHMEYGPHGIWKGNVWDGPRLKLGSIDSAVEQAIAALDFTTRNRVSFDSADHSFHTELSDGQQQEMKTVLGELFDTQGHWWHFSLNEHNGPYTFPVFRTPGRWQSRQQSR